MVSKKDIPFKTWAFGGVHANLLECIKKQLVFTNVINITSCNMFFQLLPMPLDASNQKCTMEIL